MKSKLQVNESSAYLRYKKSLKNRNDLLKKIDQTIELLEKDKTDGSLHFKKMTCKRNKYRYSIRVLNSSYRILLTYHEDIAELQCVCSHDRYDRENKNC